MIKIEFKEATYTAFHEAICDSEYVTNLKYLDIIYKDSSVIKSITAYIPTQDQMLDRSHILSILNISEQEDKLFQEQYKNV